MDHGALVDLMRELGDFLQKILILPMQGKADEARKLFPGFKELGERCLAAEVSVCVFQKIRYPAADGGTFTLARRILTNWPGMDDPQTTHADLTLSYRCIYTGHVEVLAEDIEVFFATLPQEEIYREPGRENQERQVLPPPSDGKLLSEEEMKKFLKSTGLEGLGET